MSKYKGVHSHLPDILVPDSADLLDVGSTLGDTLEGVTEELKLILDTGRGDDLDTGLSSHTADILLTQEVSVGKEPISQSPCPIWKCPSVPPDFDFHWSSAIKLAHT